MTVVALIVGRQMVGRLPPGAPSVMAATAFAEYFQMVDAQYRKPVAGSVACVAAVACDDVKWRLRCRIDPAGLRMAIDAVDRRAGKYATDVTRFAVCESVRPFEAIAGREMIERRLRTGTRCHDDQQQHGPQPSQPL